jgi:hypothetical protein
MLRARDGGSIHRLRWLDECVQLHNFLRRNISALLDGEQVKYSDICGPFCDANVAINYFRVNPIMMLYMDLSHFV